MSGVFFRRIKRTSVAFAGVAVSYCAYALIAVPFIEPSVRLLKSSASVAPNARQPMFPGLFPPGSWELDRPKILETEQGTLLFDDYQPLDGHRKLRLKRCTFIRYLASRSADTAGNKSVLPNRGRPIVMRATSGAVLDFDSALDVGRGEFGKLVGGQLAGEVLITSPPSEPGIDDAFRFTTRDVQIDARRIWTPHEVDFVYGPHRGHGRDLRIDWAQSAPPSGGGATRQPLGGIRSLELVHLDRLELQVPAGDITDRLAPAGVSTSAPLPAKHKAETTSLDVSCRGPLRVDFPRYMASLSEQVQVIRQNVEGPADQLLGELLEIYFAAGSSQSPPDGSGKKALPPLRLERLSIQGNPATIRAPSRSAEAVATVIDYNVLDGLLHMVDKDQVRISSPDYRIETTELEYAWGRAGRIGRFWATGPGRLWARSLAGGRELEAVWQQEVRLRRHEDSPVLSLWKGQVTVAGSERFSADEFHIFLTERQRADAPSKFDVVPDRMKAVGNVSVDSTQLIGRVREANLWFMVPDTAESGEPTNPSPLEQVGPNDPGGKAPSKYSLDAELLQAQIGLSRPPRVERLTLQNQVRFRQISGDEKRAISIEADLFELQDGHTPKARAVLLGKPARMALGQSRLSGTEVHLSQADNSLEIVGAGSMAVPPPATTMPLPPMQVDWQGGMRFDGRTALFSRQVEVHGSRPMDNGDVVVLHGRSATLRVALSQEIDFTQPETARKAEVQELAFDSDVFIESELLDASRQRKGLQQTESRSLTLNPLSGDLFARGPGWISSVHQRVADASTTALPASPTGIEYLRVHFLRELTGKLASGQIEFHERVRTVYGPVQSWEQKLPDDHPPGPGDPFVLLTSDRLSVADMSEKPGALKNMELEATGNALLRGGTFSASAQRIAYVRGKDQVIAEGDGRNDAVLNYQPLQLGARPAELKAGKILYCPSTRQFDVNNLRGIEVQDLQQLRSATRGR